MKKYTIKVIIGYILIHILATLIINGLGITDFFERRLYYGAIIIAFIFGINIIVGIIKK